MADLVREPAPAKLNPFLRVLGRRDDGYHEVETLILPLTLADGVEARRAGGLTLTVAGPLAGDVTSGEDNLVMRAARALAGAAGLDGGAALLVAKQVPVAAGLGGGSGDAAAALRALNDLWGLAWDAARLAGVGAEVGSDVPALVHGGPVVARGRGERVEPVAVARTWWVLVTQPFGVSARNAYLWWDEGGGRTGPDADRLLEAMAGRVPEEIGGLLFNDLEPVVAARHREVQVARERLAGAGALGVVMCGSGPTVAGLCRDGRHAEELAREVAGIAVAALVPRHTGS
ncbi:MAG TPA: 4-(cytidine 5'-diphospho)-2-C-methyl-D-erythritol kinase [Actinomycetota bacterium]|jgi:4-diphosphocytidyl-2-C-methyl-D-erythritol kinase